MNTTSQSQIKTSFYPAEKLMTKEVLTSAFNDALKKIDKLYSDMGTDFPSHASINNVYQPVKNDNGWNTGFWCGMLWLAYEGTKDEKYRKMAESLLESFYIRIDKGLNIDHHDLGFLYVPSCVAAYKLTGNEDAKKAALKAAEHLMTRYRPEGGYIQAWGNVGESLRLIVDCMNNIPLLYWASSVTGNEIYRQAAENHARTTLKYILREYGSTYHTYFFNADGSPKCGTTHQGAYDDSCWARGQAWLISGLPLTYNYVKDDSFIPLFEKTCNYFLNHLPNDYVPYWDLVFNDGDGEEKDSSAGAIAACGILQMLPNIKDEKLKDIYNQAADKMMYSLYKNYSTANDENSNGILLHAVYGKPQNNGVDECNIWGDYYYTEALLRMLKVTKAYW